MALPTLLGTILSGIKREKSANTKEDIKEMSLLLGSSKLFSNL
jgi:hypothetical protein